MATSKRSSATAPCIFIIGRHGSGKSTLGLALAERLGGLAFISLGALLRIARRGASSRDLPGRMARDAYRHRWTSLSLPSDALSELLDYTRRSHPKGFILDGAPRSPSDLAACRETDIYIHLVCEDALARHRLILRSEESARQYAPTQDQSIRDRGLPELLEALRGRYVDRTLSIDTSVSKVEVLKTAHRWCLHAGFPAYRRHSNQVPGAGDAAARE